MTDETGEVEQFVVEQYQHGQWEIIEECHDQDDARLTLADLEALGWDRLRVSRKVSDDTYPIYYGD